MTINLNSILGNQTPLYKGLFPARPVWGYMATTNGSVPSSTNHFFAAFGPNDPSNPIGVYTGTGSSNSNVLRTIPPGQSEVTQSGYYFAGSGGTQISTESFSPASGYVGAPLNGNTGCLAYFRAFDTGSFNFHYTDSHTKSQVHGGIVIGESRYNQTYDLVAYNGKIMKMPIGQFNNYITAPAQNQDFFFASSQVYSGSGYSSPTGVNKGLGNSTITSTTTTANSYYNNNGMICHNRNNNKIAYLENSPAGSTGTWRLHIIDLQNKIGNETTVTQIKSWIETAVATGSSRYNYYDINLSASWGQGPSVISSYMMKVILCDDNTMWICGWDKDDSSTSGNLRLYRCTDTATYATWTLVSSNATTTAYNTAQGDQYGIRHMNSDDNSKIFIYVPYYYYLAGLCGFIVDTRTATTSGDDVKWMQYRDTASSAAARTVCPIGGGDFLVGDVSVNQDGGAGTSGHIVYASGKLYGQTTTKVVNWRYLPTINQSTAYQSWFATKIMPTQEWKLSSEGL